MYGAPFVARSVLSKSSLCSDGGGRRCDVMPSKHLGNPGDDVMFCLDQTFTLGMTCRASLGSRSGNANNRGAKSCLFELFTLLASVVCPRVSTLPPH